MIVARGRMGTTPDLLQVHDEHGNLAVQARMGPGGDLHPRSAEEAKQRPWFYTGSPFGPHIYGLAWQRHAERQRAGHCR